MASEQLKNVIEIVTSQPQDPNAQVEKRRAFMEKISERVASDVECQPLKTNGVPAEWIVPPGADAGRVILYLHGGGYMWGSINTHRAMVARIARASQARALAIDYRLAPENPFPAAVEDAVASYRWLLDQGYQPAKIVISGVRWRRTGARGAVSVPRSGVADAGRGGTDLAGGRPGGDGGIGQDKGVARPDSEPRDIVGHCEGVYRRSRPAQSVGLAYLCGLQRAAADANPCRRG